MQSSMRLSHTNRNGRVANPDEIHGVLSPLVQYNTANIENMGPNGAIYDHIDIDTLEGG